MWFACEGEVSNSLITWLGTFLDNKTLGAIGDLTNMRTGRQLSELLCSMLFYMYLSKGWL